MGFFGPSKGELQETVRDLRKRLSSINEDHNDTIHNIERAAALRLRDATESYEDQLNSRTKSCAAHQESAEKDCERAIEEANKGHEKATRELKNKIIDLEAKILQLEADGDIEDREVDLEVAEGILAYKQSHIEDVTKLEVKLAQVEGTVAAARAEGKAPEEIVKALLKQIEAVREDCEDLIDFASSVAPKVDLNSFKVEVTVPQAPKQEKQEQKKQN